MPRLFIALKPDEALLDSLWERLAPFRQSHPKQVKFTSRENLHLTLKFLGSTPDELVPAVQAAVTAAASAVKDLQITLSGAGAFPGTRHPRVLWIGVKLGAEKIRALASRLDADLAKHGFPVEEREFHAHLTLARIARGSDSVSRKFAESLEAKIGELGSFRARELVLFESETRPAGAVHRELFKAPIA